MKKLTVLLAVFATLVGNTGYAQTPKSQMGRGASAGKNTASDSFAWGIGLGGLAVLGVVVGLTAAAASSTPSTFSH